MSQPHPELEYKSEKEPKPLKQARSQAELTRVKQGKALIYLNCLNVAIGCLIALRAFGLI